MQKNCEDFSMQDALRMAQSPAGQQLLAMLRSGDNSQLQQVVDLAKAGNMEKAGVTLQSLLSSPQAQQLLKQMEGQQNG